MHICLPGITREIAHENRSCTRDSQASCPRGARYRRGPQPVPYGTPFSAILRRFAQAPRKPWPTGHRSAATFGRCFAGRNPHSAQPQLGRLGPNSRRGVRGARYRRGPQPVPYGTPFSAILRRFAQAPQKPWPTGHRSAATFRRCFAGRNPHSAQPQLGHVGPNSRRGARGARYRRRPPPVPYGTPFWAILRRFAQAPRKPWPTGHRSTATFGRCFAGRNPHSRQPQLGRLGPNSSRGARGARYRRWSRYAISSG